MNRKKKLEEEKRFILEKQKTHWYTLAGWLPKVEVQVLDGRIAHKKWYWNDGNDKAIEMNGPLAFIMTLSCGHRLYRSIGGKNEETLREEYVGKPIYCDYCRPGKDGTNE